MADIILNEDETLNEIITEHAHLEQMGDGHWWLRITSGSQEIVVHLHSESEIVARWGIEEE